MSTIDEKVARQDQLFRRELPKLLRSDPGRWVIFLDGVVGVFDSEAEAYKTALQRFGLDGGFVVAQVEEHEPILMSAAFAFSPGTR